MEGIHARQYGNPSKSALSPETIKSSNRDTRALAAQGKRQQLSVGSAQCLFDFPNTTAAKIRLHLCGRLFLGSPHIMGGDCCVSDETIDKDSGLV